MPKRGVVVHSLIIGCGDTGIRIAARAVAAGEQVTGVVRSTDSARRVRGVGARARILDLDESVTALPACDRLFYCAPPQRDGRIDSRMARVLAALDHHEPAHVVYISTSGVYGDCSGAWVDENRPVNPQTERATRRVDAERRIQAFSAAATILRAPGIYGPNRLPVARLLDGSPIIDDAEAPWSNRVHIDDLAAIAWQAGNAHWAHRVYNASDGNPTMPGAFNDSLAELLDRPRPPRISWQEAEQRFSSMRLSFLRESRRLDNRRLLADSGYRFLFDDFRAGLVASLHA